MSTKVMIADDEEAIRGLMEATLRDNPRYRVVAASDGAEALAARGDSLPLLGSWDGPGATAHDES